MDVAIETMALTNWEKELKDTDLVNAVNKNSLENDRINLMICYPPMCARKFGERVKIISFTVFEGDRIPYGWAKILKDERINQIWVPSMHTQTAIMKTLESRKEPYKIRIIPHGVDINIFKPMETKKPDVFTFGFCGGWAQGEKDRKGLDIAIRAFLTEFKPNEKARFFAKINPAYGGIHPMMELNRLGLLDKRVVVNMDNVLDMQMAQMYNLLDVFVSPTKADAFNMPVLEAMACGVPAITTDFGGMSDYINNGKNGYLVNGELTFATDANPFYEGVLWAIPYQKEIQEKMRYLFDNPKELKKMSKNAIKTAKLWTWDNSAKKAIKALKELE